jgi:predicted membrane GTPase involved in stress response
VWQQKVQVSLCVFRAPLHKSCTPEEVHEGFDNVWLLGAERVAIDFPTVYGSAKNNWMSDHWESNW